MHIRPDIVYAVGVLLRQCKRPSLVLKSIQGTSVKGIQIHIQLPYIWLVTGLLGNPLLAILFCMWCIYSMAI